MKAFLLILCFWLAASSSVEARDAAPRNSGACNNLDKTYGQANESKLVKYFQEWVEKFNSGRDKILIARFDGFRDMGTELRRDLCLTFPGYRFIVPDIWMRHQGAWFQTDRLLLQDR